MKTTRHLIAPQTTGARLIVALLSIAIIASIFTATGQAQEQPDKSKDKVIIVEAVNALATAVEAATEKQEQPSRDLIGDAIQDLKTSTPVQERDALLAGLTGTKNIPGDYATLALAITDLNTNGVGSGGVTFNVLAGNPQTAPAGGYVIGGTGSLVLTSSSAANPIVFTGNSNTVTAPTPQASGSLTDAIFKLIGADFVTIQGFTMQENAANTTTAAATNNMTEFGVALFYVTLTDGSQNNTIQNNTITLNRTYQNTFGIYSNTRHSSTSITTSAEVTAATGSNSNNKIYGNAISNVDDGIIFVGAGTTIAAIDTGNDIGGTSAATGNTITNWGYNGTAISGYLSVTGSNFAIYLNQQINDNASFNTITSAAGLATTTVQHGGIVKAYSVASPTVGTATTTNLNSNTITLNNSPTTGQMTGVSPQGMTANSAATINVNNNLVTGSVSGASATSAAFIGVLGTSGPGTLNINGNTVRGVTTNATTGAFVGIQQQTNGVVTTLNINNNKIGDTVAGAVTFSNATNSGAVTGIAVTSTGAASTAAVSISTNDIRGVVHTTTGSGGHLYFSNAATSLSQNISTNTFTNLNVNTTGGITFISDSVSLSSTGTKNINSNSIVTAFNKGGAGGTITLYSDGASSVTGSVSNNNNNNFSNITFTGATTFNGWLNQDGSSATSGPTKTVSGNTFSNISGGSSSILVLTSSFGGGANVTNSNTISNVTGTGAITGISIGSTSNVNNASLNTVSTLSTTGAAAVTAFSVGGGTTTNVFRNKIYDIQANNASGTVNGLLISSGTTVTAYNNLIGDLRTPAANAANPLIGINITGGTTDNIYFNTVYLNATSSGAVFGSSAISVSTTPTVTLRNNVFVNTSTANTTGLTVAHRRSTTTLTTYGSASNNNDFYAGTPSASNLIFNDGTNSDQTITAYKTRVSPRDSASFTENPPFLSTTGSSANFLHINPATPTQLESGGAPIAGITDDFDGQTRNASTPDVGADEFAGIAIDLSAPVITYTNLPNTGLTTNRVLSVTITDATGVASGATAPRIYFKKSTDAGYVSTQCTMTGGTAQNGTYNCTIDYSLVGGGSVTLGDIVQYFVVAQDTAGNVGANPGAGFAATDVNTVTTPPTTPNSYTIVATFTGAINVGTGETITSLTNTGGLFEKLNGGTVSGNLTVNLTSDLTAETGTVSLNQTIEEGAGNYTIFFQASGGARVISGSNTTALINLNGADRVTFSGLAFGPQGLTIRNTSATTGAVIQMTNDASNDSVVGCNIQGGNTSTSSALIVIGAGTTTGNDNNSISSNIIRDRTDAAGVPAVLVASFNASTTATNSNLSVMDNQLINFTSVAFATAAVVSADNLTFSNNDVSQTATRTAALTGLNFGGLSGTNTVSGNSIHGFNVSGTGASVGIAVFNSSNLTLSRNRIYDFQTTAGATGTIEGLEFDGVSGGTPSVTLLNNMVSLAPTLATAQTIIGIFDNGFGGNIFTSNFNSIYIGGTATGAVNSWADRRGTLAPTTHTARNNIAYNNRTGGTGNHFAGGDESANTGTFVSNYNFFAGTGATPANFMDYGTSSSGTPVSFPTWQAGPPARDANSTGVIASTLTVGNIFVDAPNGNLHLKATAPATIQNAGTPVAGITTDFDGDTRSATPDIGADEVTFAGSLQLSAATYSVAENGVSLNVTVTRTGGSDGAVGVSYHTTDGTATSPADYTAQTGTLSWAAGDTTSKTITIPINDDSIFEGNETFSVTIDTPTGGATIGSPSSATVTINDNETQPTLSISGVTVNEGDGTATFVVTQSGVSAFNTTFNYSTADGTATAGSDYTGATNAPASINAGSTTTNISIPITDDTVFESSETFTVTISNPTNATIAAGQGTATGTITDNDTAPTFSIDDITHNEGDSGTTSYTFTVTKTGATASNASVDYASVDGTATVASDYTATSGTLTFLPADTTKTITVLVNGDTTFEPTEAFTVHLSNPTGGTIADADGTGTITNDDTAPTLSIDDQTFIEGDSVIPPHFTVTLSAASGVTVTVDYATADGTATAGQDYTATSGTLTFAPGETSQPIIVPITGDTTSEPDETFFVNLSNPTNATIADGQGLGTIQNDDAAPAFSINDVTMNEGDTGTTSFTFTVTKTGATTQNASVDFTTVDGSATVAGGDYQANSGTLTFLPADTTKTLTVLVNGDTTFEPNEAFTVHLSNPTGASIADADGTGTITNDDAAPNSVTITPATTPTATDNDYTRINNAIQASFAGQTIKLMGTFDWTETNAAASWAAGSDGDPMTTFDNYSIYVPRGLSGVTLTADNLGAATIQGPGDLASVDFEEVLYFGNDTVNSGDNQNWTISNIQFLDFDNAIGMFGGAGGADAFNNTHIANNRIRIARDLNGTVAPGDPSQNIGIHYSFGTNQLIESNQIEIQGDGISDAAGGNYSSDYGMQCNTSGGNVYDGLQIKNNTIRVLHAQNAANPEDVLGIWENAHAHLSNITISGNQFLNEEPPGTPVAGNDPALNFQLGFLLTSHSSATSLVKYENNTVKGANLGFQWLPGQPDYAGNQPVRLTGNTVTGNFTGINVLSQGVAQLTGNTITNNANGVLVDEQSIVGLTGNTINNNTVNGVLVRGVAPSPFTNTTNRNAQPRGAANLRGRGAASLPASKSNALPAAGVTNSPDGASPSPQSVVTLTSNTILTNATGVRVQDENSLTLHFNRIVGNTVTGVNNANTGGPAVNAENNWWGCNAGPGMTGCDSVTGSVDFDPWLILSINASPATINPGGMSTITVDLTHNSAGMDTAGGGVFVPPTPVTFSATEGTVTPTSGTIINGTATTTFTSTSSNNGTVSATVDNQTVTTAMAINVTAPTFSINDVTMNEGNSGTTSYTFTVTKTGSTALNASVDYASVDGTATAASDYTATSGTLTFLPADTTKTITVLVNGDTTFEPTEAFTVHLSNPMGATITDADGTGTITNDDAAPSLSINDVTVNEGNSGTTNVVFTVTLSGPSASTVTVNYQTADGTAHAPGDYTSASGTVNFPANSTSQTVTVTANGDTIIEGNETFFVNLSSPTGGATLGDAQGVGTLDNDDGPTGRLAFTKFDFDGDAMTDISIWRGSTGNWYIRNSSNGTETVQLDWGKSSLGDIAVPADYDGDGKCDIAVWRSTDGNWYIIQSSTGTPIIKNWGQAGDLPVPGDYDGDNRTDVAVWRESEGNWYILNSRDNTSTVRGWGTTNDQPVLGDFDGDRMTDIAVYRPSEGNWYIVNSSLNTVTLLNWGANGDRPAPADFDGDGKTDLSVFREAGNWYIRNSADNSVTLRNWGNVGDKLVPGKYDNDNKADIAVWRETEGNWYIINSASNTGSNFYLGLPGDTPAPAAYLR